MTMIHSRGIDFNVTVPKVSRTVETTIKEQHGYYGNYKYREQKNTYYLSKDIPGTVRVNFLAIFKNKEDVVLSVRRKSSDTEMPQMDGGSVVKLTLQDEFKDIGCLPDECLISFEIGKSEK